MNALADYFCRISSLIRHDHGDQHACETWSGSVSLDTPIAESPFVVFDTELSGLNPRRDFIVSIGAIKMTGGTIHPGQEFYRLAKPSGTMTKKSVEIHCLTPDELREESSLEEVLPEFLAFLSDSVLIGHFLYIDLRFLNRAIRDVCRTGLKNPAIDTHNIHEWINENSAEFKRHYNGMSLKTDLFSVAQRYGITVDFAHNALNDAFITAQLFQRFLYFLESNGVNSLRDLVDIGRA